MAREEPPRLEWVNHASFVFAYRDIRLICDPWLSGTAFNRGWRHISPSQMQPEDFAGITHVWFSHQHPDHFAPPDLRRIPAAIRNSITALYHKTIDKKVIRYCKSLGFKEQIELSDGLWLRLSDDVRIQCGTWFDRDSWLAIETPDGTILNLNDCVVDSAALAKKIARRVGPVRVLMSQFSYAEWSGNRDAVADRLASAREKLERIATQVRVFDPEVVIPFASFIYWCSPENFHMNAEMNRVDDVARFVQERLDKTPVVLYPGEQWTIGEPQDFAASADRYASDLAHRLAEGPTEVPVSVQPDVLEQHADAFLTRLKKHNPLVRLFPVKSTTVALTDLNRTFMLTHRGMREADAGVIPDIRMHSESLLFCLKTPWGSNALRVNGRFESIAGGHERFFRFFKVADWADHGYTLKVRSLPLLARASAFRLENVLRRTLERRV